MKCFYRKAFLALLFVFCVNTLFAEDWFICLGSFKVKQNAENRVALLARNNIPAFVYETQTDDGVLYRVLMDEQHKDRNEARAAKNRLSENSVIKALGLSGLWICSAERETEPVVELSPVAELPENENKVVLQENKTDSIPLSEEKPYSVLVRSYKEEYAAENTKDRLVEDDIDAYVLGKYDEVELFSFDVHAGAFSSEEETEELIDILEEKGIEDVEISDFNDIADSIVMFDEMVKSQPVVYEAGEEEIPTTIPAEVQACLKEFPLNKNFQIEQITILDFNNIEDEEYFEDIIDLFDDYNTEVLYTYAASLAVYRDELFGKEVEVLIALGDEEQFSPDDYEIETDLICDYKIRGGILKSKLYELESGIYLFGASEDGTIRIEMAAENFTLDEFNTFMSNSYADSNMLIYPQLRKNLFILPDNSKTQRDFQGFTLKKVGRDYVELKNYADWAWGLYGHWCASAYFAQAEEPMHVSFYDLDYDYNAQKIHKMFMDTHDISYQGDDNHSEMVHESSGWYINSFGYKELSFTNKSYIIAADSEDYTSIDLQELHEFADDLKIW